MDNAPICPRCKSKMVSACNSLSGWACSCYEMDMVKRVPPKLCIQCKFHSIEDDCIAAMYAIQKKLHKCNNPKCGVMNLVTGEMRYFTCEELRSFNGACNISGDHFEPKEV